MKPLIPHIDVTNFFARFMKASASGRRVTPAGKRISKGTLTNYVYVQKLLVEFEELSNTKLRICLLHRASLRILQREKNYWHRFFIQFSNFLYKEKNYGDTYAANVFKIIRCFFNYLHNEKGFITGSYHKNFRIPQQQTTPIVLTPEQLKFLIADHDFEHSLNPFLKRAKDIFVFGCTVALRYSDLMKLKKTHIITTENGTYLSMYTQKTTTEIRVPLPQYALDIIFKYRKKTGSFVLPRLSSTNINIQIKKLIKAAGWVHTIPKNRSFRGKMIEQKLNGGGTWEFYRHITAHTMRRTAITTLLILGVPEMVVRKVSGHAPGSKEFYKYVGIAQEYLNQEVKAAHEKLMSNQFLTTFKKPVNS